MNREFKNHNLSPLIIRTQEDVLEIRNKMLHRLKNKRTFSAKKYCGRLKLREEPMTYQKRVRQEWDEHTD